MHLARLALVLGATAALPVQTWAQSITLQDLNAPIHDEAGQLTRRLKAASASGPLEQPTLTTGCIEFYTEGSPVGTLVFDRAVYHRSDEIVSGEGRIEYRSDSGDAIAGTGFTYSVKTGLLQLRSDVVAHCFGTKITATSADSQITRPPSGQAWVLGDSELRGNVVIVNLANPKLPFDRAETDKVSYTGTTQIVTIAPPLRLSRNGENSRIVTGKFEVDLSKPAQPPPPSSLSTTPAP
jgi:hypothetical protein